MHISNDYKVLQVLPCFIFVFLIFQPCFLTTLAPQAVYNIKTPIEGSKVYNPDSENADTVSIYLSHKNVSKKKALNPHII